MKIACVGGGPGGLFFSTLVAEAVPGSEVTLFERNKIDDAYGFGVVFSDATLRQIDDADPVLHEALEHHGVHWDPIEVRAHDRRTTFAGNGMAAIYRKTLLHLLQQRAETAGVNLRYRTPVTLADLDEYDIVVAADGSNSTLVKELYPHIAPTVEVATAKFIWFGTTHLFDGLTFLMERSDYGVFAAHCYPISDSLSTFIVETDEATWRAAGLDKFDTTRPPGESDEHTQAFLEALFAKQLEGGTLVANNSRWANFRTIRTSNWHHGRVVALGDAVHTAHFSVGSGTKMAMEDADALARAIAASPKDLETAFTAYESERMPLVARIQNSAGPSLSWWEHFGEYYETLAPEQFPFHFFSRSIAIDKIAKRDAALVDSIRAWWRSETGADTAGSPLAEPLLSTRVVELDDPALNGTASVVAPDELIGLEAAISSAAKSGTTAVTVRGGTPFTRVRLSEELRLRHGISTVIEEPDASDALAETLVLSGRADAVAR
jgi:2-polyprenyl-6-methoxyphenol hydroxylase-like FAD-dependent oxidoreductase